MLFVASIPFAHLTSLYIYLHTPVFYYCRSDIKSSCILAHSLCLKQHDLHQHIYIMSINRLVVIYTEHLPRISTSYGWHKLKCWEISADRRDILLTEGNNLLINWCLPNNKESLSTSQSPSNFALPKFLVFATLNTLLSCPKVGIRHDNHHDAHKQLKEEREVALPSSS
jgi:hypothetical protein